MSAPRKALAVPTFSSVPAVVATVAPKALASWMAMVPMPPVAPWIRTVSPACSCAVMIRFEYTVAATSGQGRGGNQVHAVGNPQHLLGADRDLLRVAAARQQRHHLVPDGKRFGDARTEAGYPAGNFQAQESPRRRAAAGRSPSAAARRRG